MTSTLTVAVLGSCRVYKPINFLNGCDGVNVGHKGAEWYTHTTSDVLQKIDIVLNKREAPDALAPLLVHAPGLLNRKLHRPDFYQGADVFIVELSSLRLFPYQDWFVQQVCYKRAKAQELGEAAFNIAKSIQRTQMTNEVFLAEMDEICTRLAKPVLFVNHLCVSKDDGQPFLERERIRNLVAQFCANDARCAAFDPTEVVNEVGVAEAMTDPHHYAPFFERKIVGERLLKAARALVNGGA